MSSRMVYSGSNPNGRKVIVRWNAEWCEYIVQFFLDGEYLSLCDYHTTDLQDAQHTAQCHLEGKYN